MSHSSAPEETKKKTSSILDQPKAVWAVAFACVVSFMGIGLVDPILPSISASLDATPAQVSLLFTSYLVVTAIMMIFVGWLSSRIGPKWTLVLGLGLIVVFSGLAGASSTVNQIIGFRGGWGVGNALFIATSLAVIVNSARGGFSGAIILYEAALGLGFAVGPLTGGLLGSISWRGPFFGVAVLMLIGLVASLLFIPRMPAPEQKIGLVEPLKALKHRALLRMGIVALLYNWGFFTLLGYAPYPMHLEALQLGFAFTGWGLLVAAFAVFFAPRLQKRYGTARVLYANLGVLTVLMLAITFFVHTPAVVVAAVVLSGACIGLNNTLTTQAVMLVSPVERSVASSAYGFIRFIGGGLAPFVAGLVANSMGQAYAFALGAIAFLLAVLVLTTIRKDLDAAEAPAAGSPAETPAADSLPAMEVLGGAEQPSGHPVLAAIDGTELAEDVVARALAAAQETGESVELVHVAETAVVGELALAPETREQSRTILRRQYHRLRDAGVPARAILLTSVGDHAAAGLAISRHAESVGASRVILGQSSNGALAHVFDADVAHEFRDTDTRALELVKQ